MKKVLILGASKGLGKELSTLLKSKGFFTLEVSSSTEDSEAESSQSVRCDLSNLEEVKALVQTLDHLELDGLIWAAGRVIRSKFETQDPEEIIKTIDINFRNAVLIVQRFYKRYKGSDSEKFLSIIASSSGLKARSLEIIYASTKHALVGFTRSLGIENENPNFKVSLFLPGGMKTNFWDKYPNAEYETFLDPKKVADKILNEVLNQKEKYIEVEIPRGSL